MVQDVRLSDDKGVHVTSKCGSALASTNQSGKERLKARTALRVALEKIPIRHSLSSELSHFQAHAESLPNYQHPASRYRYFGSRSVSGFQHCVLITTYALVPVNLLQGIGSGSRKHDSSPSRHHGELLIE